MDRTTLEHRLQDAERRVAQGRARVTRQMEIVRAREAKGRPVRASNKLLENMQGMLELHEVHRERIRKVLDNGD